MNASSSVVDPQTLAYVPRPLELTTAIMGDTGGAPALTLLPSDQGGGRNLAALPGGERVRGDELDPPCCELLSTVTVAKLGVGSSCYWLDASMLVSLGTGATIVPGDSVELRPGALAQEAVAHARRRPSFRRVLPLPA